MRRWIALLLAMALAAGFTGCGVNTSPVSGLSDEQAQLMEQMGISEEELAAMSDEQRQAVLDELGIVAEAQKQKEQQEKAPSKSYTTADVAAGGSYIVTIGDGRLNNYYLYYEDGKLVKVEISFRKSDIEEEEYYLFEGDNLEEFWYYEKSLDELIRFFDDQQFGYITNITPTA